MAEFTATDESSGKAITFDWQGDAPPTNADIDEMLATSGTQKTAASIPGWAADHPNLYGVAGAAYEVGKPLLEGVGLAGGAIVGALGGNPIGGAGGGYAIAGQINQLAGESLGVREELTQSERFKKLQRDVIAGEMFEMGGQAVSRWVFEPVIKAGKWTFNIAKSFISGKPGPSAMKQASNVWSANTSTGPIYAKNKAEAEAMEEAIPGLKFTEGQRTYDPQKIKFERVAFRKPGEAGRNSVEQQSANDVALKRYYNDTFGTDDGIDDFIGALSRRHEVLGKNVEAAKKAGGVVASELGGKDIQKMHGNLINRVKANKQIAKDKAGDAYNLIPEEVEINSAQLLDDFGTIGEKTSQVESSANIPKVLTRAKEKYVEEVPAEIQELARSFTSKGKPVPAQVQEMMAEYGASKTLPFGELRGLRTEILNEMRREGSKQTGKNFELQRRLNDMLESVEGAIDQLGNSSQYGDDVAELYRAASSQWKQYSDTFRTGTIGDLLARGPRGEAFKLTPEKALSRLFNSKDVTAAGHLNRAIGKRNATKMVREYADYDIITKTKNPLTLEVDPSKLARWLQANKPILKKYGLQDTYKNLTETQGAIKTAEEGLTLFEKSQAHKVLGVDADKAVSAAFTGKATAKIAKEFMRVTENNPAARNGIKKAFTDHLMSQINTTAKTIEGNPVVSVAKFNQIYDKFAPALKEFYKGEPAKIQALKNMKKAYEIMIRNKTSPIGGGSDTMENLSGAIYQAVGHAPVGGPFKLRAARSMLRVMTSFSRSQVDAVVNRAIFDPNIAQTLEYMASGASKHTPDIIEKRFMSHVLSLTRLSMLGAKQLTED